MCTGCVSLTTKGSGGTAHTCSGRHSRYSCELGFQELHRTANKDLAARPVRPASCRAYDIVWQLPHTTLSVSVCMLSRHFRALLTPYTYMYKLCRYIYHRQARGSSYSRLDNCTSLGSWYERN